MRVRERGELKKRRTRKEGKTIDCYNLFSSLKKQRKLLPYSWFKKIFRLTLLNDCHSYQRIWHIGLDGLLCCVLLINLQTQQLSLSQIQINFPYAECFLKKNIWLVQVLPG